MSGSRHISFIIYVLRKKRTLEDPESAGTDTASALEQKTSSDFRQHQKQLIRQMTVSSAMFKYVYDSDHILHAWTMTHHKKQAAQILCQ